MSDTLMSDPLTVLTSFATIGATIFAGIALLQTSKDARAQAQATTYSALDDTYRELLALAVDKPHFRNPEVTTGYPQSLTGNDKIAYEAYAYSVWNFIETIFDRCEKDARLKDTWLPVVTSECALHRKWFDSADRKGKFKRTFVGLVEGDHVVFPVARDAGREAA
jgi:hypothetical protein